MLKLIYTLFLGLILAGFVGVGIATFYPQPKEPVYPTALSRNAVNLTDEEKQQETAYQAKQQAWFDKLSVYNRNVSIMALIGAIAILLISLGFNRQLDILSDGVLLGGVFTLFYSIGRGLASGENIFRFILITIGLLLALLLGYWKFIRPSKKA